MDKSRTILRCEYEGSVIAKRLVLLFVCCVRSVDVEIVFLLHRSLSLNNRDGDGENM